MHHSTCSVIKDQIKLIFDSPPRGNVYQGQHINNWSYLSRIRTVLRGGGRGLAGLILHTFAFVFPPNMDKCQSGGGRG